MITRIPPVTAGTEYLAGVNKQEGDIAEPDLATKAGESRKMGGGEKRSQLRGGEKEARKRWGGLGKSGHTIA